MKSTRSSKHHTSTPYDRPRPKGFVQTVKDWLTPSKWTKPDPESHAPRFRSDHTPWPGTPHPIQGRQLDARGVTHPLTPPSFNDELGEIRKDESIPFMAIEEAIEDSRSGSNTPLGTASPSVPYSIQNGLDPPPLPPPPSRGVIESEKRSWDSSSPVVTTTAKSSSSKASFVFTSSSIVSSPTRFTAPPTTGLTRTTGSGHATPKSMVSSYPSRGPPSFSLSAFNTPVNTATLTNLSLSRSPFTSPFYAGRTSYGGASSSGRPSSSSLFRKRTRNETSPTNVGPVKRAVKPHPHTTQFPAGGASHTALKILDTLQSMSTPLQDARKLPLRAAPAKKQRIEGPPAGPSSSPLSPPPPVSSLSAPPTHAKLSQVRQPVVRSVAPPPTPPPSRGKDKVVIDLTISPEQTETSQAPPPTPPPSSSKSSTGKMRIAKQSTTHYSTKNKDAEEECYNTLELPPPIPLLLPKSGPLSSFDVPFIVSSSNKLERLSAPSSTAPRLPVTAATSNSYSFTSPNTASGTEPRPHVTPVAPGNVGLFRFSAPRPITENRDTKTALTGPVSGSSIAAPVLSSSVPPPAPSSSGNTRKPLAPPGSSPIMAPQVPVLSAVPPLLPTLPKPAGSLLDALKKPEFQIENIRKEAKGKGATPTAPAPSLSVESNKAPPPLVPLKDVPLIVPMSNWSCDSCWVSNKSDVIKCVACGASQPSGGKKKSVAFTTPTTIGSTTGGSKLPLGEILSTSGGSKLPSGVNLSTTTGSSGGLKFPPGDSLSATSKLPQGGSVLLAPMSQSSGPSLSAPASTSGSGFKLPTGGGLLLGSEIGGSKGITQGDGAGLKTSNTKPVTADSSAKTPSLSNATTSSAETKTSSVNPAPLSSLAPPTSNWECPTCMISNGKDVSTCVACGTGKPASGGGGVSLKPSSRGGKWECPTCMLHNDVDKEACPACGASRPGSGPTGQTGSTSLKQPVQFGIGGGMKLGGSLLMGGASGGLAPPTTSGDKPTLQIGSGGGLKLGPGGGLNIFGGGGGSKSSSSASTGVTSSSLLPAGSQPFIVSAPSLNLPSSSLSSSFSSSGSGPPSLSSSKPPLLFVQLPTSTSLSQSSASTSNAPLLGGGAMGVGFPGSGTAPSLGLAQQPVSSFSGSTQTPGGILLPPNKPDLSKGALTGLKFEAPPPPVLSTSSEGGGTLASLSSSLAPSSGFPSLATTSVGSSLFQSFLTPPTSAPASMFSKPSGGGEGQKLLFGGPNLSSGSSVPVSKPSVPPLLPSVGGGLGSGGLGSPGGQLMMGGASSIGGGGQVGIGRGALQSLGGAPISSVSHNAFQGNMGQQQGSIFGVAAPPPTGGSQFSSSQPALMFGGGNMQSSAPGGLGQTGASSNIKMTGPLGGGVFPPPGQVAPLAQPSAGFSFSTTPNLNFSGMSNSSAPFQFGSAQQPQQGGSGLGSQGMGMGGAGGGANVFSMGTSSDSKGRRPFKKAVRRHKQ